MTKNTLLITVAAGLFATAGAYAQTSNGNSSNAASMPTASPMQGADTSDGASAPMKKHHKMRKPGASAATENGQGK